MIHENDPSFLKELDESDRYDIEQNIKEDEGIFVFKSTPFESLDVPAHQSIFSQLKKAVKNHEYRTIVYQKNKMEELKDLKCLKLVYMNNNWYLATEDSAKQFRFLRLSFIQKIKYASKGRETFQSSRVEEYNTYFASLQNAMTLVGKSFDKTVLKASPRVALYFAEDMKPFFPSQEYVRTEEDGSVVFSIEYTQPLEVLPFIKQWQPDISILAPLKLKDQLVKELQQSLNNHSK
jgi:predicted DNA-binding transcriptional regulator YafY